MQTIKTIHGELEIEDIIEGANVNVRILSDKYDNYFVQYEFSRDRGEWRFCTAHPYDDMSHPRQYDTKRQAKAYARIVSKRNNRKG